MRKLKSFPFFLAGILLIGILIVIPLAHASTFIGYLSSNVGTNTCGGGFCSSCTDPANSGQTCGTGMSLQSPLTGQLVSVSFFTGTVLATSIQISVFGGATPSSTNENCNTNGAATCQSTNGGQSYTLQDQESLGGLTPQSFFTVNLANPVSITTGQWVAATFMSNSCSGTLGSSCQINIFCGTGCGNSGSQSGLVQSTCIKFGSATPTVGNIFASATPATCIIDNVVGGSFQISGGVQSSATQCYGNCGTPPVTLINTNSTHSINFNQSITLFYEFQSNLNGFILNVTSSLAKAYSNGQQAWLGIYEIPSCPIGVTPFTSSCPGLQQRSASFAATQKGKFFIGTNNLPVSNGEWVGISISATFSGLDINDTNTTVPLFATNGVNPQVIQSSSSFVSCACKMGLWAFINGNTIIAGPPISPTTFCDLTCSFITIIGLGFGTNLLAGGLFYWIIFFLLGSVALYKLTEGSFPPGAYVLYGVMLLFIFSAMGIFPVWVPIVIFLIVALLASGVLGNLLSGSKGSTKL